jgi:DNA-binding transcriptional ArsR family regulator
VRTLRDVDALRALCHPTRIALLELLREPASAASIGRRLGQPRQRVNYHLKALHDAGLVEKVGTQRQGNFVESLYRATARSYVVSPEVAWADPRRLAALRRDQSLETLVALGARLQHDAAALLDGAAFEDEAIASAAVSAETHFAGERERAAFMREYLEATRKLVEKYGGPVGSPYRVVLAVHPKIEESHS